MSAISKGDRTSERDSRILLLGPTEIVKSTAVEGRARFGNMVHVEELSPARLERAKAAFTTRRVPFSAMATLVHGPLRPRPGDVVLARVDRIRHPTRLELRSGRKATLNSLDEIVVAYGNRYATDQFEALVPLDLRSTQLVASGGITADMISRSAQVSAATQITPLGLIGDVHGMPLNLSDFGLRPSTRSEARPRTIAVLGTAMNSGKTTTVRSLIYGLRLAGQAPGAAKVTGTGSGNDYWAMHDAGAHRTLDFTDVGLATTYRTPLRKVEQKLTELVDHLAVSGCGIIILEIADGVYQRETSRIIQSRLFQSTVDGVLFAAGDAMGAVAGARHLSAAGLNVMGVSGLLSASPLATREAAEELDVAVYTKADLRNPEIAPIVVGLGEAETSPALSPPAVSMNG